MKSSFAQVLTSLIAVGADKNENISAEGAMKIHSTLTMTQKLERLVPALGSSMIGVLTGETSFSQAETLRKIVDITEQLSALAETAGITPKAVAVEIKSRQVADNETKKKELADKARAAQADLKVDTDQPEPEGKKPAAKSPKTG